MIVGVGTDIVQIPRIEKILSLYKDRFASRILSSQELVHFSSLHDCQRAVFLAKRFAAKEAVSKALGTGMGERLSFRDVVVSRDERGKPIVRIISKYFIAKFSLNIHLSISDDYPVCVAFVVISDES